jgi:hypothetical protein
MMPRSFIAFVLLLAACRTDPNSSRGTAEQFVDQHYVHFNLAAAKPFCSGLALRKLEDELRLTAGHAIDEGTRLPKVRYRLLEEKHDAQTASFVFEGTIEPDGADPFTSKWLVTVRQQDGIWKVSNFEELG